MQALSPRHQNLRRTFRRCERKSQKRSAWKRRAHNVNFHAYIFEDLLQRHFELSGNKLHRVMNITEMDNKTIRGAREAKVPLAKFTAQFKEAFFEDVEILRIKRANEFPAAT